MSLTRDLEAIVVAGIAISIRTANCKAVSGSGSGGGSGGGAIKIDRFHIPSINFHKSFKSSKFGRSVNRLVVESTPGFLVACTRLYNPLRLSVGWSVGRSVRNTLLFFVVLRHFRVFYVILSHFKSFPVIFSQF